MYNNIVRIKGDVMTKYIYMKLIALLLIIIGFSYCLTSFYNFYSYLFGDIEIANGSMFLMTSGLAFPMHMFIFGVFFYFYTDKQFAYINPFILAGGIIMLAVGILRICIGNGIMEFIHPSFAYVSIVMGILVIIGCFRYKY